MMALVVLLGSVSVGAGDEDRHGAPPADDPRFDFLKRLEGMWVGKTGQEEMNEVLIEFRVTAGGHAIEEREMIGTPMEMVTLYYMRGKDLVATHYCVLGNQPQLRAAKKVVNDTLDFACDGKPGNTRSHAEEHVHGWSIRLNEDDTLYYSAELVKDGDVTEAPAFVLTRQLDTASR
jgi:hypothetical protein